jgi:hypothetical protein
MASEVSICNQALALLGANPIISLDDNTTEANLCKTLYPDVRDSVLEESNWSFATKWLNLPPLANPPVGEYANAFPLPSDVIRIIFVGEDFSRPEQWQREGNNIRKDGNTCKCQIVHRENNPNAYSPLFVQALAARMAMEMAVALTNNASLMGTFAQMYEAKLDKAVNNDSAQGRARKITSNWLQQGRVSESAPPVGPIV